MPATNLQALAPPIAASPIHARLSWLWRRWTCPHEFAAVSENVAEYLGDSYRVTTEACAKGCGTTRHQTERVTGYGL